MGSPIAPGWSRDTHRELGAAGICLVLATSLTIAAHLVDAHLLPARADTVNDVTLPYPAIFAGAGILVAAAVAGGVSRTTPMRVLALCVAWPGLLAAGAWFAVAAFGDWQRTRSGGDWGTVG